MEQVKSDFNKLKAAAEKLDSLVYKAMCDYDPQKWLSQMEVVERYNRIHVRAKTQGNWKTMPLSELDKAKGVIRKTEYTYEQYTLLVAEMESTNEYVATDQSGDFDRIEATGHQDDLYIPEVYSVYYAQVIVRYREDGLSIAIPGKSLIQARGGGINFRMSEGDILYLAKIEYGTATFSKSTRA
jgi:hypothetical protein